MTASPSHQADFNDAVAVAKDLLRHCDKLNALVPAVASARSILSFSGDRLKRALALAVNDALAAGATSFAQAESKARSSGAYRDSLDKLQADDEMAEKVVAEWMATTAKIDALRSLVSLEKSKVAML